MAKYQIAFVRKDYITNILEADSAQEAWDLVKSQNILGHVITVYSEIESLTSINEITEERIDTALLDL